METMQGKRALITGASSGIGAEYARQLAAAGCDLLLTARRAERLRELADRLREKFDVSVDVLAADLSSSEDLAELEERIAGEEKLGVLVNNAGFGLSGNYLGHPVEAHQQMIDVHISATVRLTHAAIPVMSRQERGYIINVSSIAAFIPFGGSPGYSASKAYLNVLSTHLAPLLRPRGIWIQSLCPGYTYTEFHTREGYAGNERERLPRWAWMTPEKVVQESLRRIEGKRVIVVPGWKNRVTAALLRSPVSGFLMSLRSRFMKSG